MKFITKFSVVGALCLTVLLTVCSVTTRADDSAHRAGLRPAKVGEPAPVFRVEAIEGLVVKTVSLDDYRGKWLVLFFYPADFRCFQT